MLKIITSGAFAAALEKILPIYSKKFNVSYKLYYGSSFGLASDSIPSRIKKGDEFDIFFLADSAIDLHSEEGILNIKSKYKIISSDIGVAVRENSKIYDIKTLESFKSVLIKAKSIALAASASGIYLQNIVIPKIFSNPGEILNKSKQILGERVGKVIARGEAEIGFQQLSELIPIKGINILGMLPIDIRKSFIFGCATSLKTNFKEDYVELINFIRHIDNRSIIENTGVNIL